MGKTAGGGDGEPVVEGSTEDIKCVEDEEKEEEEKEEALEEELTDEMGSSVFQETVKAAGGPVTGAPW